MLALLYARSILPFSGRLMLNALLTYYLIRALANPIARTYQTKAKLDNSGTPDIMNQERPLGGVGVERDKQSLYCA